MTLTVFLCGDVMTGRGVDQVMARSVEPTLFEPAVKDARAYVELAEGENGPIPAPVEPDYVWGDALEELERIRPEARIINLETSVTTNADPWKGKGIHYRMHPDHVTVLEAAKIDCCVLANNHVMDWGTAGLEETLSALERAGIATAGAGRSRRAAEAPAVREGRNGGRILIFAFGLPTSGVPRAWAAAGNRPGVNFLEDLSSESLGRVAAEVGTIREAGDLVVVSLHWGGNWGYQVTEAEREFAHGLVDEAGADVVHGHSSHHPKGIEIYRGRPILYGCGDFLNDYEGIPGHEAFRGDLTLMYFPTFLGGELIRFRLVPLRIRRFRLTSPDPEEVDWLRETLDRESRRFGTTVSEGAGRTLEVRPA